MRSNDGDKEEGICQVNNTELLPRALEESCKGDNERSLKELLKQNKNCLKMDKNSWTRVFRESVAIQPFAGKVLVLSSFFLELVCGSRILFW